MSLNKSFDILQADADGSFPITITIWSGASDDVDHENLDKLIAKVGKNRLITLVKS